MNFQDLRVAVATPAVVSGDFAESRGQNHTTAGVFPVPSGAAINGLDWLPSSTGHIGGKSEFGELANCRPAPADPPEKKSPGTADTATRAKKKSSRKLPTATRRPAQLKARRLFTVTCGRETIGEIEQDGRRFRATIDRLRLTRNRSARSKRDLGTFTTIKAAAEAYGGAR